MRLIRFGTPGRERPGVILPDGTRLDVSEHIQDYTPEFFAAGGLDRLKTLITEHGKECPPADRKARLGPPISRPHKFLAIGLNYRKHAQEVGAEIPKEPIVFTKQTSCICGPNDHVVIPKGSTKLDYEVELAVVMKTKLRYLEKEADAMKYVAGFTICNDVSERNFQLERGPTWTKGKSADTFGPLGPYLTSTEDVSDYANLDLQLKVNGEIRQNSNTNDLIFTVPHLVWYISQFFTLEPGDVITTGTPSGVAQGMKPPRWLRPGDVMELAIAKLGTQTQTVVAWE
jgi:2-keto-4-pentenoate hydratase/2-oxohepta-3-ene-1,7-dioic acid hydratase in catechol pathway